MIFKHQFSYKVLPVILILLAACTKDFEEINTDPILVSIDKVKSDEIFTFVLKESIFESIDFGRIGHYSGYINSPSSGFPLQNIVGNFGDYRSNIVNIAEVVRLTSGDPLLSNKNAMAKIWKVWLYYRLTDNMGPIPYSEAALAFDEIITKPKYDDQESIYKDLLSSLKAAAAQLTENADQKSPGNADILFQGDVMSWKRFANSLRLRLAMRVRYADANLASTHINEVINAPLIDDNSLNADLSTEGVDAIINDNRGPFYNLIENNSSNALHASLTVSENLLRYNDPRLSIYLRESESAGYRSRPFNLVSEDQKPRYGSDSITSVGEPFRDAVYVYKILTAAEVSFLKAEAALYGIIPGDAQQFYTEGIQQAMDLYAVPQEATDQFLTGEVGTLVGDDEQKLESIITQKYLAIYYQTHEAWAEFRRTGYPLFWVGKGPTDTGGQLPRRQKYPLDEYAKNQQNVESASSSLSLGDDAMSKVWWDAKAGLPFEHPMQGQFPPERF